MGITCKMSLTEEGLYVKSREVLESQIGGEREYDKSGGGGE